jgi:hypothetical protein
VEAIRRVLVMRESDRIQIDLQGKQPTVSEGDLVVAGAEVAPGVVIEESGQVNQVTDTHLTLRLARPYRVSTGAVLHIDDGDLVQRGDNLVLLVFERAKTGTSSRVYRGLKNYWKPGSPKKPVFWQSDLAQPKSASSMMKPLR